MLDFLKMLDFKNSELKFHYFFHYWATKFITSSSHVLNLSRIFSCWSCHSFWLRQPWFSCYRKLCHWSIYSYSMTWSEKYQVWHHTWSWCPQIYLNCFFPWRSLSKTLKVFLFCNFVSLKSSCASLKSNCASLKNNCVLLNYWSSYAFCSSLSRILSPFSIFWGWILILLFWSWILCVHLLTIHDGLILISCEIYQSKMICCWSVWMSNYALIWNSLNDGNS